MLWIWLYLFVSFASLVCLFSACRVAQSEFD